MSAFPKLYDDLTKISAKEYLSTKQVVSFVSEDTFSRSKPKTCLIEVLQETIDTYPNEIEKLLRKALPKFAGGFDFQKGAIFGFGPSANLETRSVLKLSEADEQTISKLDNFVDVHNMHQERNVGSIGYGLATTGKDNLKTVSRRLVIKSSTDKIITEKECCKKFRKEAHEIKNIMSEWHSKMAKLQEEG